MSTLFPRYDKDYTPTIIPSVNGESIDDLHDRVAYALHNIVEQCDKDGVEAIIICTHAASLYAIGRALTGQMPEKIEDEDFRPFTCGLSTFIRRTEAPRPSVVKQWAGPETGVPKTNWRNGVGVQGGWDCTVNGDCSFLTGGEERGCTCPPFRSCSALLTVVGRFSGDESFIAALGTKPQELDAGSGLGVVIEGNKNGGSRELGGPRL